MATSKSKVDYLKRYGYKPENSSKKRIKKVKKDLQPGKFVPKTKIFDDDIDINAVAPNENDDNDLEYGDDAPQIVGVVDERPVEIQKMELFATNKWRVLGDDQEDTNSPDVNANNSPGIQENRRQRHDSDSDESMVNRRPHSDSDQDSLPRKVRHDSGASPPRQRARHDSDESPPRRSARRERDTSPRGRRVHHGSGESPSRGKMRRASIASSQSPSRRNDSLKRRKGHEAQHNLNSSSSKHMPNDSDTSPPRRKTKRKSSASPPRRNEKHSKDISPVRQKARNDSNSPPSRSKTRRESISVLRRKHSSESESDDTLHRRNPKTKFNKKTNDMSRRKKQSDSDNSPTNESSKNKKSRHRSSSDSDQSYHREKSKSVLTKSLQGQVSKKRAKTASNRQDSSKSAQYSDVAKKKGVKDDSLESDSSPPRKIRGDSNLQQKTLDGKKAGLQDSKTLKLENEAAKERERRLFEKMGEEMSGKNAKTILRDRSTGQRRNLEEEKRKQMEEDAIKAEREAKYHQWGKGLKQTEMQKSRLEQDLQEISKPLARYKDDADLDKVLREQDRDGDPMLAFIKKKKAIQSGGKELPKYNGPQPPPNRFGIMPGYRWDGVDRSCGFEKSRFTRLSNKVAAEEEAYKWSVEDM